MQYSPQTTISSDVEYATFRVLNSALTWSALSILSLRATRARALVSIIGLDDMVHRASLASAATREPFTFYALIGLIYLAVTTASIIALGALNRRMSRGVKTEAAR